VKAIVVGAGFAGLAAADELQRAGVEVAVYEARNRVGGRVHSFPFAGAVAERGAEFVLPGNEVVFAAVERLGLALVRKGTRYGDREPKGGEPVTRAEVAAAIARIASQPPDPGARTMAGALASYRLPSGVAEAIRARIEVSCAYPADDLAASVLEEGAAAFGAFDTYTVEGGNDRIAREIAARLGDRVHLASPVRRIAWGEREVRLRAGARVAVGDAVVLAVPAPALCAMSFDPPLPPETVAAVRGVRFGHAAKLFVPLRTPPAQPSATLSVLERFWCYTQLGSGGEPLPFVAAFAGTPGALEALDVRSGPGRWVAALERLRPDLDLDPAGAEISTWTEDPWARGAYSAASATSPIATEILTRPVGPLAFAGEHTAGDWHALMEGALRSGARAAQQVLQTSAR
jgi:monoamine oxidase